MLVAIITLIVVIIIQVIFANHMKKVAILKGYGDECNAWAMCFWLGALGALYVVALPDLIQQSQNQQIIDCMREKWSNDTM